MKNGESSVNLERFLRVLSGECVGNNQIDFGCPVVPLVSHKENKSGSGPASLCLLYLIFFV
jgi:hypothetical protein